MSLLSLSWPWVCVSLLLLVSACRVSPAPILGGEGNAEPQTGQPEIDLRLATEYLQHFYGLKTEPSRRTRRSDPSFASKVSDMQSFFGLNVTGHLDSETLVVMKTPRCGVPDVQDYSDNPGSRWTKSVISYSIRRYTADLPSSTVDSLIGSALNVWGRASPLTFVRSFSQQADIIIEFGTKDHGDSYPFDGPRGTLAHAFSPGGDTGGDTHFDDDEEWTAGSEGFNLYLVAAHEFGHSLGLRHSTNPRSLMYPTYKNRNNHDLLSREDFVKINTLYGRRTGGLSYSHLRQSAFLNPWFLGRPRMMQNTCDPNLSFDAVTTLGDAFLFFKDSHVWIKHNQHLDIKEGPIKNFMPKIPSRIDAAYSVPKKSSVYLFKGTKFWTMRGSRVTGGPKSIYKFGFWKGVRGIDAATHVNNTGRTLFFARGLYWSYDENRRTMEESYPRHISDHFPGVDGPISAAVHSSGFLNLFQGTTVFKYDYAQKQIVSVEKANVWLGC